MRWWTGNQHSGQTNEGDRVIPPSELNREFSESCHLSDLPKSYLVTETVRLCFRHQDTRRVETHGSPEEERLGNHRSKEKAEASVPKYWISSVGISEDIFLKGHLIFHDL